jgi:hypothetical protein
MASILCRKGETFPNSHRHSSVLGVKICQGVANRGFGPELATFTRGADPVAGTQYNGLTGYRVDPALEAQVPAGRYAIRSADTGTVRFYRVDKPTKGRWAGRTFVKVQASDDLFPIYGARERAEVLRAIAADVRAASVLYGRELGRCGVCGRTLTDEQSRAEGIGPVCASKL